MTMLAPKSKSLKITRINDEVYNLVNHFYPRRDFIQVLQLKLLPQNIMNIMNCSEEDAYRLFKEMQFFYGHDSFRLLIPHFCHYMGIDEQWVHLFIASLKKRISIPAPQTSFEPSYEDPFAGEERLKLAQAIENLKHGKMDSREARRERARLWKLLNTRGEKRFKRYDNFRMVIYSDEVAGLLRIHLRTAQSMLREIRQEYEIPRKAPISISRFCFHYKYQEEEIRMGLACMYGEEYIAP
jgi:hypothetical protein